jgi:hypothetical protein
VDGTHTAIVQALRQAGCSVLDLRSLGSGAPDLLVGFRGRDRLLEVKTARGRLLEAQKDFALAWRGHEVSVVRSVDEALAAFSIYSVTFRRKA